MEAQLLDFSVIVPLSRHHGKALECIRSWCQEQTLDRDRFEVLVVSDGAQKALEERIATLFRGQDRLIQHASSNEFLLYNVAAEQARGEFLFFAECHSHAAAGCLSEMLSFLRERDLAGARCRSEGLCIGNQRLARLDLRAFEEETRAYEAQGHWRKVLIHGFAIKRSVFLSVGGFESEYGQFSQIALAIRLHEAGVKLGFCARSLVQHYYDGNRGETEPLSRDNNRGEILFRSRNGADLCERYVGRMLEWSMRGNFRASRARRIARALLASIVHDIASRDLQLVREKALSLLAALKAALLGSRPELARLVFLRYAALAKSWMRGRDSERSYQAHQTYLRSLFLLYRREAIEKYLADFTLPESDVYHYDVLSIEEERLYGFHPLEEAEEIRFRWSKTASLIQVTLPAAQYELNVYLLPIRLTGYPLRVQALFDGHPLSVSSMDKQLGLLSFRLEPPYFAAGVPHHDLTLISNEVKRVFPGEPERALPLKAIEFHSVLSPYVTLADPMATPAASTGYG